MASIYGPAYCITGKIPHSVLKQACNKPALNPALSPAEGMRGKHRGRITLNMKKALGEQSMGLCSTCTQHSPIAFRYHAGKKTLNSSLLLGLRRKSLLCTKWDHNAILGLSAILLWAYYSNPVIETG